MGIRIKTWWTRKKSLLCLKQCGLVYLRSQRRKGSKSDLPLPFLKTYQCSGFSSQTIRDEIRPYWFFCPHSKSSRLFEENYPHPQIKQLLNKFGPSDAKLVLFLRIPFCVYQNMTDATKFHYWNYPVVKWRSFELEKSTAEVCFLVNYRVRVCGSRISCKRSSVDEKSSPKFFSSGRQGFRLLQPVFPLSIKSIFTVFSLSQLRVSIQSKTASWLSCCIFIGQSSTIKIMKYL